MVGDATLKRCVAFDCAGMMNEYDIHPLVDWGTTPEDKKANWDKNKCNEKMGVGLPKPMQQLKTIKKKVSGSCHKHYAVECDRDGYPLNGDNDAATKGIASAVVADGAKA